MLGFFFWRGWLVLIFTIVLIKFFHKTFVCKSMKQLFFTKWNNVNNIKKCQKKIVSRFILFFEYSTHVKPYLLYQLSEW